MSEVTSASMRDARDAEDKRLLEEGRIDELLSGWVETIRGRCVARMRGPVGLDVAQAVCLRLWRELKSGKHGDGTVPFRVVVHNVIGWACAGWYERGWGEAELVEIDGPEPDPTDEVVTRLTLEQFVGTLPTGDGEVARQLWLERPAVGAGADCGPAGQGPERRVPGDPPQQDQAAGVARGMKTDVATLLDELARRHARCEPLDVEGLLQEAGGDADELAVLIDRFLESAPRQQPSDGALSYVRTLEDPPLLIVRRERRLKIDDVVDSIIKTCQLPAASRNKVRRYYQMLEGGTLDPHGVAARIWNALADAFGRPVEGLARAASAPPGTTAPAMYRRADALLAANELARPRKASAEPEPLDEVDALFIGPAL